MFGKHGTHDVGQRDRPESGLALRWPEFGYSTFGPDELAVDPDLAVEEVDPVDAEAEALALAEAGAGGEHDESPVAVGTGVRHLMDLGGGQRHDLAVLAFGQGDAVAR